jgi:hypothetical protein
MGCTTPLNGVEFVELLPTSRPPPAHHLHPLFVPQNNIYIIINLLLLINNNLYFYLYLFIIYFISRKISLNCWPLLISQANALSPGPEIIRTF